MIRHLKLPQSALRMFALFLLLAALGVAQSASPTEAIHKKIHSNCPGKNAFALTFSDGIFNSTTYSILDILDEFKVKATFFVSAFQLADAKNEAAVKEAVRRGHTIGSLGYSHRDMTKLNKQDFDMEIEKSQRAIQQVTGGAKPKYFRAPYGTISESMVDRLKSFGLKTVNHNVNPMDWRDTATEREIIKCVATCMEKNESGIIMLHDLYPSTISALPAIIRTIRRMGKKISSIDECLASVDNN